MSSAMSLLMLPLKGSPQISRTEVLRSQRSSLHGDLLLHAGRVAAGVGPAKSPGGRPGGNVSQHSSAVQGGAKCTLRATEAPGGGKSRRRTMGGRPLGLGSASGAVGSLQGFSQRVDTLSVLSLICRVIWCRDYWRMV